MAHQIYKNISVIFVSGEIHIVFSCCC